MVSSIVELACGLGLATHIMLLLDNSTEEAIAGARIAVLPCCHDMDRSEGS